ncbi:predicted protein [Botrytis cinerea T4]|uniref:Uncharacterized protein n=1 Tax=Botryotinia fuckeliana (strain T4) TaxID=999810 RepID=G2XTH8_BOTF4|nr:predicted protein [Botrytis cinerea T4]
MACSSSIILLRLDRREQAPHQITMPITIKTTMYTTMEIHSVSSLEKDLEIMVEILGG